MRLGMLTRAKKLIHFNDGLDIQTEKKLSNILVPMLSNLISKT